MYSSQGLVLLQEICKWHLSLNDKKLQQYEHLPWPSTNHKDKHFTNWFSAKANCIALSYE
jgi:hypothetical protein